MFIHTKKPKTLLVAVRVCYFSLSLNFVGGISGVLAIPDEKMTKLYCVPNFISLYVEAGRSVIKITIF